MREILFRAKRTDNGEWCEGSLLYDTEQDEAYIAEHFEDKSAYIRAVDPNTVGQYAGIQDKDGKRIFEADIVEGWHEYFDKKERYFVKHEGCGLYFVDDCATPWNCEYITDMKVIGNAYDNPELLEVSECHA